MNELIKKLFEGVEGLSPEFLDRADTLISVAIAEEADKRAGEQTKQISESFDARLDEAKNEFIAENVFRLDSFLEKAMLEWSKENAVALDAIAKVELAESFLTGFKDLFTQANITIPKGDEKKVLEDTQAKVVELGGKLEEAEAKLAQQNAILEAAKREDILSELTEGLVDTQIERVKEISKNFALTEEADFRKKVGYVVEAVGGKVTPKEPEVKEPEVTPQEPEVKIVENNEPNQEPTLDPLVAAVLGKTKRT